MDEPLSALDKKLREEIRFKIKCILLETGVTIPYVTHDQEEALRLSDRVALFDAGRVEQIGTGRDLYDAPTSRFVAGFIGNSNFLEGKLSRSDQSTVLPDGTALRGLPLDKIRSRQDDVAVMIRPDHFRLHDLTSDTPKLSRIVTGTIYLGEHTQLAVALPWGAALSVRLPPGAGTIERGHPVDLTCTPADLRVF